MQQEASAGGIEILLRPHRSLSQANLRCWLYFTAALVMVPSILFVAAGLWGVLPFSLLELALFACALRLNACEGEETQTIQLDGSRITISTPERALELDRYWSRVRMSEGAHVWIESKGRRIELGSFLCETERRALAGRLGPLVGRIGELPPLIEARGMAMPAVQP